MNHQMEPLIAVIMHVNEGFIGTDFMPFSVSINKETSVNQQIHTDRKYEIDHAS